MSNICIIGGSHGISSNVVQLLRERQHCVFCACRTPGQLKENGLLDDPNIEYLPFDVTRDELSVEKLPEVIEGFVYFPGSINLNPLASLEVDQLRADIELNAIGAVKTFQAILPKLRAAPVASAVFLSTVAVSRGIAMHGQVAAAKGALESICRCWAAELAPQIRVNCVAPALTDTPLAASLLESPKQRDAMAERYPLGRVGRPKDIAQAIAFLLDEDNSWITGQVIGVDGGMSATVSL